MTSIFFYMHHQNSPSFLLTLTLTLTLTYAPSKFSILFAHAISTHPMFQVAFSQSFRHICTFTLLSIPLSFNFHESILGGPVPSRLVRARVRVRGTVPSRLVLVVLECRRVLEPFSAQRTLTRTSTCTRTRTRARTPALPARLPPAPAARPAGPARARGAGPRRHAG